MMNDLGKALMVRIQELAEERGGKIDINNLDEIIISLAGIIKGRVNTDKDAKLYSQIEKIADQVKEAKQAIRQSQPEKLTTDHIPDATSALSTVTAETEQATNEILNATETIQELSGRIEDVEIRNEIINQVTRIFEASNFQDLTGQRINKVITTLTDIEDRMGSLIKAFSTSTAKKVATNRKDGATSGGIDERSLLNGPQMSGEAPSQDAIDDLFNNA